MISEDFPSGKKKLRWLAGWLADWLAVAVLT
jgi:hypothetical protein